MRGLRTARRRCTRRRAARRAARRSRGPAPACAAHHYLKYHILLINGFDDQTAQTDALQAVALPLAVGRQELGLAVSRVLLYVLKRCPCQTRGPAWGGDKTRAYPRFYMIM